MEKPVSHKKRSRDCTSNSSDQQEEDNGFRPPPLLRQNAMLDARRQLLYRAEEYAPTRDQLVQRSKRKILRLQAEWLRARHGPRTWLAEAFALTDIADEISLLNDDDQMFATRVLGTSLTAELKDNLTLCNVLIM